MSSTENQPLHREEERTSQHFCLANIKFIARTLGLITVAVMWVSGVVIVKDHKDSFIGYYLFGAATIVTFFEFTWIVDKSACCVREGCCCRIWAAIMWVDNWKKCILYVLLSIPLFLEDMRLVLGIVSGLLLIFLGAMYLIKTFRSYVAVSYQKTERQIISTKTPSVRLVSHEISTQTEAEHHVTSSYTTMSEISEDGGTTRTTSH